MDFIDHSTAAMAVFNLTLLKNDEIEAKRLVDYPYTLGWCNENFESFNSTEAPEKIQVCTTLIHGHMKTKKFNH